MTSRAPRLLFVSLALATGAFAQQDAANGLSPARRQPIPAEPDVPAQPTPARNSAGANRARMRVHLRPNGATRAAGGFRSRAYAGSPNQAARSFLNDNPALLDRVDMDQLRDLPPRRIAGRSYARFQQQLGGIPVRGAHAVVAMNGANEAESFTSHLEPALSVKGEWKLTAADAVARVAKSVDVDGEPKTEKLYVPRRGQALPVWRVVARSANPAGVWAYLISADDGSVIESQNLRKGQQPLGYAYSRSPLQGPVEKVPLDGLGSSSKLTTDQTTVYNYLPVIMGQAPPNTLIQIATRKSGNFLYTTDDPRFSEVQLFYGMQRANARFRDLGFPGWDTPLAGVVLYQDYDSKQGRFVGADNAYFSPEDLTPNGGLFFYLTPKNGDMTLDSDVIFHEYTHSVVEYAVGSGQSMRFQAINEGTADYFSDSFMDEATEAEFAAKVFGLRAPYLRRADNRNQWPYNLVGEAHADGNIWSGALWDVRNIFGADAANRITIYAVASLSPDADFFDAAAALYGDDAADLVADVMTQRGILSDAAQTASESEPLTGGSTLSGRISAASPGVSGSGPSNTGSTFRAGPPG